MTTDVKIRYFTFGQDHVHRVNGKTFDCDCVVQITSSDPRWTMIENFGTKWAFEYDSMPQEKIDRYYPRGIIEL
jgi:hypothetical protein